MEFKVNHGKPIQQPAATPKRSASSPADGGMTFTESMKAAAGQKAAQPRTAPIPDRTSEVPERPDFTDVPVEKVFENALKDKTAPDLKSIDDYLEWMIGREQKGEEIP